MRYFCRMTHLYLKALHLVAVIAWFSGLFYLGRMFVFHREAMDKPEPDRSILISQFVTMEKGVYKLIINPAMMVMWTLGIAMIFNSPYLLGEGWLHGKLGIVFGLTLCQLYMKRVMVRMENGELVMNSRQFRLFNEVPTLALISVPMMAFLKNSLNPFIVFGIVAALAVLIFWGVKKRMEHTRDK